jgi:RNA polymerase sigma-B factor
VDDFEGALREFARTRDVELRNQLVSAQLGLVQQLARRFARRGESLDDLIQVGSIGLIKAVEGFKPELGYEFGGYATMTILGELKRHFRDKGWSIRAPRRVQERYLQLREVVQELSQRLGRSPTVHELSQEMQVPEEEVLEALDAGFAYRSDSLDRMTADGAPARQLSSEDNRLSSVAERLSLRPYIARLPQREREILQLRFVDDLTQSEIAERLGISQMHVSRLLSRSIAMLHSAYVE